MPKRILVDATHTEETRIVVLENGRVSEFDSETSIKKQLKGNIYLAKITRVEPSLQAAFVDYGGDKHGFLPFSEIHPDYYSLPVADKQALLNSLRSQMSNNDNDNDEDEDKPQSKSKSKEKNASGDAVSGGDSSEDVGEESLDDDEIVDEDLEIRDKNLYRKYKIQEVIKRNQIVLIQVEKEERGNKGASITTFISLAGRFCVLMPNSLRNGGVSRRIENREDRKRLKAIIKDLKIPPEKGIIIRTAGAKRGASDIKADYDYLAGLWNGIREGTLEATAPAFIHAEGDIIKRAMRDIYSEDIDEVLIEGDDAYKSAKDFSQSVMGKQLSNLKKYTNKVPIFTRYKVEEQIAALYKQEVPLKSGGALVISPTEALISIDVNSGRATSKRNVEETALATNLEAAKESALQLRLRDLSGLIVIDFIDMMDLRNKKAVEAVLRDAFADDRARIQIGRISTFGLLEMSRQRLAASFLEVNTMVCPHCDGAGVVKATESTAVTVLRAIENDVSRGASCKAIAASISQDVAMYILNNKRAALGLIESKYGVKVLINVDNSSTADGFYLEKTNSYEAGGAGVKKLSASAKKEEAVVNNVEKLSERDSRRNKKRKENEREGEAVSGDKPKKKSFMSSDNMFSGLWRKIVE